MRLRNAFRPERWSILSNWRSNYSGSALCGTLFLIHWRQFYRRMAIFCMQNQAAGNRAPFHTGKHFLQIPGPTNVPDRVLRAMDMPTTDHRGPEFAQLGLEVLEGCRAVFKTKNPVVIYPSSGTGAWEAAIVNTLSPGDKVLMGTLSAPSWSCIMRPRRA
jgi:hypothetical protein